MMSRRMLIRIALVAIIAVAVVFFRTLPLAEWLAIVEIWVRAHPVAGPLIFAVISIVSVVAMTPGWIPMSLAGLLFGFLPGTLYALAATTIGAAAALVVGRTLARRWVERRIAGNERMLALDDALEDQAFTIVMLTRLALVIPFNILNYAYGLTRVRTGVFIAATFTGMLPIVAIYAYLGSIARDIGEVIAGNAKLDVDVAWIAGIAVVVIAIVVLVVRRAVRQALQKRTHGDPE